MLARCQLPILAVGLWHYHDDSTFGLLALFLVDRVRLAAAAALRLGLHFTRRWLVFWCGLGGATGDATVGLWFEQVLLTALLGAVVYLYFKVHIQPDLERDRHWSALGLLELKEDFLAIGLGLLPAYWVCWRRPLDDERGWTRAALTAVLAFVIWWGFLVGHIMNDIMGFGS